VCGKRGRESDLLEKKKKCDRWLDPDWLGFKITRRFPADENEKKMTKTKNFRERSPDRSRLCLRNDEIKMKRKGKTRTSEKGKSVNECQITGTRHSYLRRAGGAGGLGRSGLEDFWMDGRKFWSGWTLKAGALFMKPGTKKRLRGGGVMSLFLKL